MDGRRATGRVADVVRTLSPDVVCLQEIHQRLPWSGREDQPAVLSAALSRPVIFQRSLVLGFGGYGIAVATRAQVVDRVEHKLPSMKEQRGLLEVRLRAVGGLNRLTVLCTHWGLKEDERLMQADATAAVVNAAPSPVVLCGDLNEGPSCAAVRRLLSLTGLQDADVCANRPTFPSDLRNVRIDFILFSPDLLCAHVEVVESAASDHLPVLADLQPRFT